VQVPGTPLDGAAPLDPFEFVRTIAVARVMMPQAHVRLSAGRTQMNDELQALCFFAGANSIFYGERLLTTSNPQNEKDRQLFQRLGIKPEGKGVVSDATRVEHSGPDTHGCGHCEHESASLSASPAA